MKLRTQQLLKLYHKSYTRKEAWKKLMYEEIIFQHPRRAQNAENAARYWSLTGMKLRRILIFM